MMSYDLTVLMIALLVLPMDAARMALVALYSSMVLAGQVMLQFMRSHRIKINLRVLASKKLLAAAAVLYAVVAITRTASC